MRILGSTNIAINGLEKARGQDEFIKQHINQKTKIQKFQESHGLL